MTAFEHIGEVIEASTIHFLSQALQNPETGERQSPRLGRLVKARGEENGLYILGVVSHVETRSMDGVHRPVALNLTRRELREQQPQIFDLLSLEFRALIVGYWEKGIYYQHFPPYPPQIHDFTFACNSDEVIRFSERLFCLRNLIEAPGVHDEVVAAFIRQIWEVRGRDSEFLLKAGQELAYLLKDQYERLRSIAARLQL
ncbi:hypothetical protein COW36_24580 [bacterium (Candidatus Blackallbacteria) CG17_big_fil_post_rev_8_21_14_2_50_48_46]|uniref:Helicase HerA barrel domain-containing protein n=1 Tax=bacterium (Candidatus Blackallbacteria) CG17_big_fil_post_rev_8_21_14_2_50_48_46 TaxID=2014261 RepID=A0A2M7FYL0_9BACT|nr:MAG: hypothetical protein COW64_19520 [bacterium (Candidatus Blackallbacteria) CG18_big_fil_WC_8_21_14_2_50_49_26]PIW13846.1 MAG: hypothetical protein COW36_24580 [bacterium (Candidatus Blackallbacteria) CG17_big_fil_post_rev_8_21_14_2_50_48_46]PIW45072.1 MAG: hypothetical protein COW20_22210 [bacterium (Candidatus Blackallbacteria) CG13_big_fil_rev_8_21_14_2_50_49_14]